MLGGVTRHMLPHLSEVPPPSKQALVTTARADLRADVCKYRPEIGKIKFLKNPPKIM